MVASTLYLMFRLNAKTSDSIGLKGCIMFAIYELRIALFAFNLSLMTVLFAY